MPARHLGRRRAPVPPAARRHALCAGRRRVSRSRCPATIAISVVAGRPRSRTAPLSVALAAASALCPSRARAAGPDPTVAVVAALTDADLFVPPDAGPPFVALAFAIIGAVVRGARLWALISVRRRLADRDRRERLARARLASVPDRPHHPRRSPSASRIGEGIRARLAARRRRARAQLAERRTPREQEERSPHRPRAARRARPLAEPDRRAVRRRAAPLRPRARARARGAREHPHAQRDRARRGARRAVVPARRRADDHDRAAHAAAAARAASRARRAAHGPRARRRARRSPRLARPAAQRGAGDGLSHRPGGAHERGAPLRGIPRDDRRWTGMPTSSS